MIKAYGLTKRYGDRTVVQDLDFTVHPGTVTGFLGPNGAGKSTTMRMLLGLDTPTRGRSTIGGSSYATHGAPLTQVGTLLEARSVHPAGPPATTSSRWRTRTASRAAESRRSSPSPV
ncbi:hypothetical protein GCM10010298_41280 [Streptomyces microflavus]|uniref:ABC transporter domain-containing protein n=1 Tax=Streptomyces microflavus TaxID=1919 RepID=A0A7J0CVB3_STRMI|nr:hypothetical protein Smic_42430 [Streptomyces microflavus]GGX72515.1 hypothetical protein GCM10010298_41280 [Streptomyces microflavus]